MKRVQPLEEFISQKETLILAVLLLLGLLHGLAYVFLVPPWQHYDEPNHFEYAWILADTGGRPEEIDSQLRAGLARSMIAHDFFRDLPQPDPDNLSLNTAGLRYAQFDEPPLYYLLLLPGIRLLESAGLEAQLYASRLASLGLYLLAILAAWGTMRELTRPGNLLRLLVPLTLVLLPGFVDLMTAVNNDVGAVAMFSLFVWGTARLLSRGATFWNLIWVLTAAGLCLYAKSTVFVAIPLAVTAFVIALLGSRWSRIGWVLLAGGAALAVAVGLYLQEPASWYRNTSQDVSPRIEHGSAPLGNYVLQIDTAAPVTPDWLDPISQPLSLPLSQSLQGQTVTLGAWMWADFPADSPEEVNFLTPILENEVESHREVVQLSTEPRFVAFRVAVPENANRLWLSLSPRADRKSANFRVYYDGVVLATGEFPLQEPPQFADEGAGEGVWGGQPFTNLLRNGSFEKPWPALRAPLDDFGARFLPDQTRPNVILYSLLDIRVSAWLYGLSLENLFETFWARFGWGHVRLVGPYSYAVLAGATLLAAAGVTWAWLRSKVRPAGPVTLFLVLSLAALWLPALLRSTIYLFVPRLFLPASRYAYPAVIPTVLLLTLGWAQVLRVIGGRARLSASAQVMVYFVSFLVLDIIALSSIIFFYGRISL